MNPNDPVAQAAMADLYRLFDLPATATRKDIEARFKARIRILHPDNQETGNTQLAAEFIKAYKILGDDILRRRYDSARGEQRQDDDTLGENFENLPELPSGKNPSDIFRRLIAQWSNDYDFIQIEDNYFEEMGQIFAKLVPEQGLTLSPMHSSDWNFSCDTCHKRFVSSGHHDSEVYAPYIHTFFDGVENTIFEKLDTLIPLEFQNWEPFLTTTTLTGTIWGSEEWEKIHEIKTYNKEFLVLSELENEPMDETAMSQILQPPQNQSFLTKFKNLLSPSNELKTTFIEDLVTILNQRKLQGFETSGEINSCLDVQQVFHRDWDELRNHALARENYQAAIIYSKLEQISNPGADKDQWHPLGVELHSREQHDLGHVCFLLGSCDLSHVADQFRKNGEHKLALEYYLKARHPFRLIWEAAKKSETEFLRKLDENHDQVNHRGWSWYKCWILHQIKSDPAITEVEQFTLVIRFILEIVGLNLEEGDVMELLQLTARTFSHLIGNKETLPIHEFMYRYYFRRSNFLAMAAYHFILDITRPESKESLLEFHANIVSQLELNLRQSFAAFNPISEGIQILLNVLVWIGDSKEYLQLLELVSQELQGPYDVEQYPPYQKSMHLLLQGKISQLRENYVEAVRLYQRAFQILPSETIPIGLAQIFQDYNLHCNLIQHIYQDFASIRQKLMKQKYLYTSKTNHVDEDEFLKILGKPSKQKENDMLRTHFSIPPDNQYLYGILKNETAIDKRLKDDPIEAAFAYINLTSSTSEAGGVGSCLIMACHSFLEAMTVTKAPQSLYAYKKSITLVLTNVYVIARRASPLLQGYLNRAVFVILTAANELLHPFVETYDKAVPSGSQVAKRNENLVDDESKMILIQVLSSVIPLAEACPLAYFPNTQSVMDTVFLNVKGSAFLKEFNKQKLQRTFHPKQLPVSIYAYYRFEGVWRGWLSETAVSLESAKLTAMLSFLKEKEPWHIFEVQGAMQRSNLARTTEGWRIPNQPYSFPRYKREHVFSRFDGAEINLETGKITFALSQDGPGLFTWSDIQEICQKGITYAIFNLDQPDDKYTLHPFQEANYAPQNVSGTRLFDTLVEADYRLKEFCTGVEVNPNPPFGVRPTSQGLIPDELMTILKPVHEYPNHTRSQLDERAHRFWIEMETVQTQVKDDDDKITILLGDVKASIRKCPLKRDETGKLVDDEDADLENSAEAQFAKTLTQNYDRIGAAFPEFMRLKQLTKIILAYRHISGFIRNLKSLIETAAVKSFNDDAQNVLSQYKNQITYPLNTSERVASEWNKFSNQFYAQHGHNSQYYIDYSTTTAQIATQLAKADAQIVSQLITEFNKFGCHPTRATITGWLTSPPTSIHATTLLTDLSNGIRSKRLEKLNKMRSDAMESLGITNFAEDTDDIFGSQGECVWFPSAFASLPCNDGDTSAPRIYGGVKINPVGTPAQIHRIYSARVLDRMGADSYHGFAAKTTFVQSMVLNHGSVTNSVSRSGYPYRMYTHVGTLNGANGTYEIGARVYTTARGSQIEKIDHMFFRPDG